MKPLQVLPPRLRVDIGVMAVKEWDSTLPESPELEPHYQIQFSVITRTLFLGGGGLTPLQGGIQSAYSKPCQQDENAGRDLRVIYTSPILIALVVWLVLQLVLG